MLLYHLKFGFIQGGFLGVDIFFVISGFVITKKLAEGNGNFLYQIREFYMRRAKRILPASLAVTLATSIAAALFLAPISRGKFAVESLASSLFSANLNFARVGNDYLAGTQDPSPFLHYWSLGVEEQFYIIWPILFILLFAHVRRLLKPTLFALTFFALWFTSVAPVASFYLPLSRAWEFLAGAILATGVQSSLTPRGRKILAITGWATITASIFFVNTEAATPGVTTLIAVVGTMCVIAANRDVSEKLVLPWLGDYSFSLYLVHWPIIVILLARTYELNFGWQIFGATLSLALAWLLTHLVERPFRFNPRLSFTLRQWAIAVLAVATVSGGTLAAGAYAYSHSTHPVTIDVSSPVVYADGCHLSFVATWPATSCIYGDKSSNTTVMLVGDSHAAQWFPAIEKLATERKWKLVSITKSSCPAVIMKTKRNGAPDKACATWQIEIAKKIAQERPSKIFMSGFTNYQYPRVNSSEKYESSWNTGLLNFIALAKLQPSQLIYIEDTPTPQKNSPACISRDPQACDFGWSYGGATASTESLINRIGATYISLRKVLCPVQCSAVFDGKNVYRDSTHISVGTAIRLTDEISSSVS